MELEPQELTAHVQALADKEGVTALAERLQVSRQTIYNICAGGWPTREVMEKLDMRLVWRRS